MVIVGVVAILALMVLPQWWVKKVFADHGEDHDDIPGTGGEFAAHIIKSFEIDKALVQSTEAGSHFDPKSKAVMLSDEYFRGKSLTAITVAAHEIGHLIQMEQGNSWLMLRIKLAGFAQELDKIGRMAMFFLPFVAIFTRSPAVSLAFAAINFSGILMNVILQLITLPMELDASFGKALPLLIKGEYIKPEEEHKVRRILWAAAFTYLASALSSLLNLARWFRLIRR